MTIAGIGNALWHLGAVIAFVAIVVVIGTAITVKIMDRYKIGPWWHW